MVPIHPQRSQFVNDDNAYRVTNIYDENDIRGGFQKSRQSRSQQKINQQQQRHHRPGQRSRSSLTQYEFSSKNHFSFSFDDKNYLIFSI